MTNVIYPFSADPITYGHIDIIRRAASAFENVYAAIGVNPNKQYTFSLEERLDMAKRVLSDIPNVEVTSFSGLLVRYAKEKGIKLVIKGVRDPNDLNYELNLHYMGESQDLDIDTFLIPARREISQVSSSAVKAMQKEQAEIDKFVPLYVKQCLEARISGQYILGLTGEIGSGKSYIGEKFVEWGEKNNISVHNIELDKIGHQILSCWGEPLYVQTRKAIVDYFGKEILLPSGEINRKVLGNYVFNDPMKMKQLNEIMSVPLRLGLSKEMYQKRGIVIINSALVAESGLSHRCNNNVIMVNTNDELREERLMKSRSLTPEQIKTRLENQYDFERKKREIEQEILTHRQGKIFEVQNDSKLTLEALDELFKEMVEYIDIYKELKLNCRD